MTNRNYRAVCVKGIFAVIFRPDFAMRSSDALKLLSTCRWFEGVPIDALRKLSTQVERRNFNSGEYIYRSRDLPMGVYGVLSGSLKIGIGNPEGHSAVTTVLSDGSWFGEIFLWAQQAYFLDCCALQSSCLLFIPKAVFTAFCEDHPMVYRNLLRDVATKALSAHWMAVQYKLSNPEMQIARRLLVALHMQPTTTLGEWVELKERLSHELIAQMLGLSRPRVTQAIKTLVQQGLMTAHRGRICIHDEKLSAYCR